MSHTLAQMIWPGNPFRTVSNLFRGTNLPAGEKTTRPFQRIGVGIRTHDRMPTRCLYASALSVGPFSAAPCPVSDSIRKRYLEFLHRAPTLERQMPSSGLQFS